MIGQSSRWLARFPCVLLLLISIVESPVLYAAKAGAPPKTIKVDCSKGQSINEALADNATELLVRFSGTCAEDVVISRDDVTLEGADASATIVGAGSGPRPPFPAPPMPPGVRVAGASRVRLTAFTVADRDSRGIEVRAGSSASLDSMLVRSAGHGLIMFEGSSATIADSTFDDNGGDGIGAWDSSSVALKGEVSASGNGRVGILASNGSSVTFDVQGAALIVNENTYGLYAQYEGSFQISQDLRPRPDLRFPEVKNNSFLGIAVLGGSFAAGGVVVEGSEYGVAFDSSGYLELTGATVSNNAVGLFLGAGETFLTRVEVTDNAEWGLSLEAGTAYLRNVQIHDNGPYGDVVLEFGAQMSFSGTNTIGTVECDGTVLVRGSPGCPPAVTTLGSSSKGISVHSANQAARERLRLEPFQP